MSAAGSGGRPPGGADGATPTQKGEEGATPPSSDAERFFEALVGQLGGAPGVRKVLLVDRAGRVIARHGIAKRTELVQLATLSAGLHATSARIAEMAGDPGRSILRLDTTEGGVFLVPLPVPSTYLLLVVLEPGATMLPDGSDHVIDEIAWVDSPGWAVSDALDFESSLERSIRRAAGDGDEKP